MKENQIIKRKLEMRRQISPHNKKMIKINLLLQIKKMMKKLKITKVKIYFFILVAVNGKIQRNRQRLLIQIRKLL